MSWLRRPRGQLGCHHPETWEIVNGYRFAMGSRPVVTLCGEATDFTTLITALDTSTPKRRLLRLGLLVAARLRLFPIIARRLSESESEEVEMLTAPMHRIATEQGRQLRALAVVWPGGDRIHRRYVTGVDAKGTMCLFTKVTLDPALDWYLLQNEMMLLDSLAERPISGVRTPRVFYAECVGCQGAVVMEAIPAKREHLDWAAVRELLPLRGPTGWRELEAGEVPWLDRGLDVEVSDSFRECVNHALSQGLMVGVVNGDVRPNNVVVSGGDTWLFDWEYAAFDAPANTDLVAALLNARTQRTDPDKAAEVLVDFIGDLPKAGVSVFDAAVSLLYLSTVAHPWALLLMKREWPPIADAC